MRNPNLDVEVYSAVTISNEWFEIIPQKPLKAEREVNELILWFTEPQRTSRKDNGIIGKNGIVFAPEIEIVDDQGKVYKLSVSPMDSSGIGYCWRGENNGQHPVRLPSDKAFVKIRIKSSQPLKLSSIIWRNYDPSDSI